LLILKRVELQGFKSFCDRSEMRFNGSGVAAVVGPNGCGKSNLSDAISWVLGEQSAKSLRGTRMEDVIFAGTRDRKPVGMAQVSLVLMDPTGMLTIPGTRPEQPKNGKSNGQANGHSNGDAAASSEESINVAQTIEKIIVQAEPQSLKEQEITITRRLFRSGESEYLINGRISRLRDIQDLFMGTGLGPESYAIIEQGRIGQILSSKPLDRRAVIEEAAGISKFKTKRRLAEAKLEGAKQNLTRVFDILEEVTRQVNSLKRQAGKAKRYEELKGELDEWLKRSLTGRYLILEREAARVAIELNQAAHVFQETQARVAEEDKALAEARQQAWHTETELTGARQALANAQVESERVRGQIENQARQVANIEQRFEQGEQEGEQLAARLTALETERVHLAESLDALKVQAAEARQRLAEKNAEREQLTTELREKERSIESSRQQVLRLLGEASSLRNQISQAEAQLSAMERDSARVGRDAEAAGLDIARLDAAKSETSSKLAARQEVVESLGGRRKELDAGLQTRRGLLLETRRQLDALKTETSRLRARKDSLEEILSHRAYTAESVKRLFTAVEQNQSGGLKPAGVLADFVELSDPRFEKATEEFLHEELEYVVVRDFDDAQRGLELLRGDLDGRATFLVEPALTGDAAQFSAMPLIEPAIGPETGIAGRLSDGIRFTNGLTHAPASLVPRLARCYLAEDRASAQRLSLQHPDLFFLLSDGVCYHGHAVTGGKRTGSGPLALKRELRELAQSFAAKQGALTEAQQQMEQLETEIQAQAEELETVRAELQREEKETLVLDQEMRKVNEEFNRASQRLSVSRKELERIGRDAEGLRAQCEQRQAAAAEKDAARIAMEASLEDVRATLEEVKSRSALLAEEHSVLRVELAGLDERCRGVESASGRLEAQIRDVARRRTELSQELERLGVNRAHLLENNLELDQRSAVLAADLEKFTARVTELAAFEAEQRAQLAASDEALKALRSQASILQEKRSQVELELVRRQGDLKYLDENCRKDLSISVAELAGSRDQAEPEPDEIAVAEAEDKVSDLKRRIESLGPVNPEALTEYQESQQRYDFLNTQRQDLIDSIRDTEKAILEIDVESRKRFTEAFGIINEHFKEMFRVLFGGGMGEMRLTGEGDTLDQGIEIQAQPPGKRLQNVQLLSGGEKALTAVALLMAIFRYQPSPFCIMDEVDAPLDELNVGRLAQLLKEMAAQTQFIVITHAKKSMEIADMLYGVTMQEQGVSKLVSVRLQAPPPPPPPRLQTEARA